MIAHRWQVLCLEDAPATGYAGFGFKIFQNVPFRNMSGEFRWILLPESISVSYDQYETLLEKKLLKIQPLKTLSEAYVDRRTSSQKSVTKMCLHYYMKVHAYVGMSVLKDATFGEIVFVGQALEEKQTTKPVSELLEIFPNLSLTDDAGTLKLLKDIAHASASSSEVGEQTSNQNQNENEEED